MNERRRRKGSPTRGSDLPSWHAFWAGLDDWKQHLFVLLFLLVVSVGFFAPVHFSGKSLIGGDIVHWQAMAQSMLEFEESTGDAALWAGNAFGGMPGYMISPELSIPQIDSVFRLLRGIVWPSSYFLLLLSGTYLLGWYLTSDKLAGLVAAVAYGLTTYLPVLLVAGHNSKFIALCWAPWLLLAFVYLLRKPSLHGSLLFAVAVASNLRAGHVQITYFVTVAAIIWFIVEAVSALRKGEWRPLTASFGWLLAGSVLGLMMVAEPYLAHAEYARHTIRGSAAGGEAGGLDWSYAMAWSQGRLELLTLLIADALGGEGATYWGPKTFTAGPHYVGGLVIGLAGLALWKLRDTATVGLGLGVLFMLVFALGENAEVINRLAFDVLPMFSAFRVPETWLSVTALLLALLASRGLATLRAAPPDEERPLTRDPAVMALGAVLVLVAVLFVFRSAALDFEKPQESAMILQQIQTQYPNINPSDPQVSTAIRQEMARRREARVDRFTSDALRTMVVLAAALALIVLYRRRTLPYWAVAGGFALIVLMDLGTVGRRYVNESALTVAGSADQEVRQFEFDRFLLERVEEAGGPGHFRVLSLAMGDPSVNARPSYFYESLGGYSGAKLRVFQDYLDHILRDPESGNLNPNALDIMNVRYFVYSRGLPGYELVYRDDQAGLSVYRNPDSPGRAWFVDEAEVLPGAEAVWERLRSPDFDASETVLFLERDAPGIPADTDSGAAPDTTAAFQAARVIESDYTAQDMTFSVETDRPRWLVISEVYYPEGWKATIDGEPAEIAQADYLLRAIRVPEGRHDVRLYFEPASYTLGRLITGFATILTYGALLVLLGGRLRRRKT